MKNSPQPSALSLNPTPAANGSAKALRDSRLGSPVSAASVASSPLPSQKPISLTENLSIINGPNRRISPCEASTLARGLVVLQASGQECPLHTNLPDSRLAHL